MKYLDFYYDSVKQGKMFGRGLCNCLPKSDELFKLFTYGMDNEMYWGADYFDDYDLEERAHNFTPLRQNIILLMAAMAGELD